MIFGFVDGGIFEFAARQQEFATEAYPMLSVG